MVFVDTGVWYSLIVPDEPHHRQVIDWLSGNREPLLTTDFCLAETLSLFVVRKRAVVAMSFGKFLLGGTLSVLEYLTESQMARAFVLFEAKCRAGWSFTDRSRKIVIDDLGIRTALALDDHFRQFGIVVVPYSIVPRGHEQLHSPGRKSLIDGVKLEIPTPGRGPRASSTCPNHDYYSAMLTFDRRAVTITSVLCDLRRTLLAERLVNPCPT